MSDAMLLIMIAEAKVGLDEIDGIENRYKEACKKTKNHWMCTDKDAQMRAAIGATLTSYDDGSEERKLIEKEIALIKRLNAFLFAASNGLSVDAEDIKIDFEPIGFVRIWQELNKEPNNAR